MIYLLGERLNHKFVEKTFKSAQFKVIVRVYFPGERLSLLIICEKKGIEKDEYENIFYNGLYLLIEIF